MVLTSVLLSFDKEDSLEENEKVKVICERLDVPIQMFEKAQREVRLWREFAEGKRKSDEEARMKYPRLAASNLLPSMLPASGDARDDLLKEMRLVMGEIVKYHEDQEAPLKMQYSNFKEVGIVVVPKMKNKKAFVRMSRLTGWLDKLFAHLESQVDHEEQSESCILGWVLGWLCKERAQETAAAAKELGWVTMTEKMTEVEAPAMWEDANITRHARFTCSFQVSNSKVETLAGVQYQLSLVNINTKVILIHYQRQSDK